VSILPGSERWWRCTLPSELRRSRCLALRQSAAHFQAKVGRSSAEADSPRIRAQSLALIAPYIPVPSNQGMPGTRPLGILGPAKRPLEHPLRPLGHDQDQLQPRAGHAHEELALKLGHVSRQPSGMIFGMVPARRGPAFGLPRNRVGARMHGGAITAGEDIHHRGRNQHLHLGAAAGMTRKGTAAGMTGGGDRHPGLDPGSTQRQPKPRAPEAAPAPMDPGSPLRCGRDDEKGDCGRDDEK
jgi:hypothetical protein